MKPSLLLLLLLPMHAFAQYRPMYTPSRPSYTPSYTTSPSSANSIYKPNSPYQVQVRQQQYAHQQFQQFQAQQRQQMQTWANLNQRQAQSRWQQMAWQQQIRLRAQTPKQIAEDQAIQQKAEQQANEQLAHLAQEQQRKQNEHPISDVQQAAAQQQEDAKQLKLLAIRNYQNVFLPGQVMTAMQSQLPSAKAQEDIHVLAQELSSNSWWKNQTSSQLSEKLAAHSANLTALSLELRRAEPAATPTTSLAPGQLDALLAADKFDQQVTSSFLREAAQTDKLAASPQLLEAIQQFTTIATQAAAATQDQASDQKALRKQVQTSVKRIQLELVRYQGRVAESNQLFQTQRAIAQATAGYLAKQEGKPNSKSK